MHSLDVTQRLNREAVAKAVTESTRKIHDQLDAIELAVTPPKGPKYLDPEPYYVAESESRHSPAEIDESSTEGEYGGMIYNLARWEPREEYRAVEVELTVGDLALINEALASMGEMPQVQDARSRIAYYLATFKAEGQ